MINTAIVLISAVLLEISDFKFTGCAIKYNQTFCVQGKLSDSKLVDINDIFIITYCSKELDLLYMAEFCSGVSLDKYPNCYYIHEAMYKFAESPENYKSRRLKVCRGNLSIYQDDSVRIEPSSSASNGSTYDD